MNDKLLNAAITISGKEEKLQAGRPVCKIKDEKGLTFTVYKLKQDGSTSVAWEQLQDLAIGDTVQIGFSEEIGDYQGKAVTYRTIRNFNKDIGEGMKRASEGKTSLSVDSVASQRGSNGQSDDQYWDKKAYKQCLWGYWMNLDPQPENLTVSDLDKVWTVFKQIETDADRRFATGWEKAQAIFKKDTFEDGSPVPEELPVIQQGGLDEDQEYDISEIPF